MAPRHEGEDEVIFEVDHVEEATHVGEAASEDVVDLEVAQEAEAKEVAGDDHFPKADLQKTSLWHRASLSVF